MSSPQKSASAKDSNKAAEAVKALTLDPRRIEEWDEADRRAIREAKEAKGGKGVRRVSAVPSIDTKEAIKKWREWLKGEMDAYADTMHPRGRDDNGAPKRISVCCSHAELMGATNVGVRLYFDLLRLFFGFAVLGLLCHVPSFYASIRYVDSGAYSSSLGFVPGWPTVLNLYSLGARAAELDDGYAPVDGCPTAWQNGFTSGDAEQCRFLNSLTAFLDVLYTLFFFVSLARFQRYARGLDVVDRGENVMISEYSIELYGLKGAKEVTPLQMKEHVESALKQHAEAMAKKKRERYRLELWKSFSDEGGKFYEVADVTMIANENKVLKGLLKMSAAEAKPEKLEAKKDFMKAAGKSEKALKAMDRKIEKAEQTRQKKRDILSKRVKGESFRPVGAIITFNREEAVGPALELFSPSEWWIPCCPPAKAKYARITTDDGTTKRRLRAYETSRPQDIVYENLHTRLASSTKLRRTIANFVLALLILAGMIVTITGVISSGSADIIARLVVTIVEEATAGMPAGGDAGSGDMGSGMIAAAAGNLTNSTNATMAAAVGGAQCTADDRSIMEAEASTMTFDRIEFLVTNVTGLLSKEPSSLSESDVVTLSSLTKLLIAALKCFAAPVFTTLVSIVTVSLNLVIGAVVKALQGFGRYSSISMSHMSEVIKLAFTQFINIALIQIFVNQATGPTVWNSGVVNQGWICFFDKDADLGPAAELIQQVGCAFGKGGILLRGQHFDASPRWYNDVGAGIKQTIVIQLIVRIALSFVGPMIFLLKKSLTFGSVTSVEEAQTLVTGPDIALPGRLGKLYAFTAVCLLFSTGMPVMYGLLAIYMFSCYFIDKWSLLRVCATPVPYSVKIISATMWWVKYILVAKVFMGWWFFASLPGDLLGFLGDVQAICTDGFRPEVQAALAEGAGATSSQEAGEVLAILPGFCYVFKRITTTGSLIMFLGVFVAFLFLLLQCICARLPCGFLFALCKPKHAEVDFNPPFLDCVGGKYADIPGVKKRENGTLVLRSETIPDKTCCSCKIMAPHTLMLYICGIEVKRSRIRLAKFNELPNKKGTISGRANTTYAPFFQPRYAKAFQFAHGKEGDSEKGEGVEEGADAPASVPPPPSTTKKVVLGEDGKMGKPAVQVV